MQKPSVGLIMTKTIQLTETAFDKTPIKNTPMQLKHALNPALTPMTSADIVVETLSVKNLCKQKLLMDRKA